MPGYSSLVVFSEVPIKLSEKDVMRTAEWFRCDNTKLSSRDNLSVKGKLSPIVCIAFIAMAIFLHTFLTSWLSFDMLSNLTPIYLITSFFLASFTITY